MSDGLVEEWARPGAVIGDRFLVKRKLGAGGMGYVVLAWHADLGEEVAVKLLLPGRALSEEARNRLVREARAAAKIRSEHGVRILDVATRGPGSPYIVMEYLNGETLAQHLARTGRLTIERAADIVIQTCEALAEAHRNGTVHRDLKPSNLFLTSPPGRACFVKVLDFGIAKTREAGASTLTQSQALLASPAYAPPEQLRASKEVDARSDIWSLGVILYESLTGRLPFGGSALAEISSEILRDRPSSPCIHRADVPEALEQVILRCLEKDPNERFENVEALVSSLESFAPEAAKTCLAHIRALGAPIPIELEAQSEPGAERSEQRSTLTHASVASPSEGSSSRSSRRVWVLASLGAALSGVVAASLLLGNEPSPAELPGKGAAPLSEGAGSPVSSPAAALPTARNVPSSEVQSSASSVPRPTVQRPTAMPSPRPTTTENKKQTEPAKTTAERAPSGPTPLDALPLDDLIDGRK